MSEPCGTLVPRWAVWSLLASWLALAAVVIAGLAWMQDELDQQTADAAPVTDLAPPTTAAPPAPTIPAPPPTIAVPNAPPPTIAVPTIPTPHAHPAFTVVPPAGGDPVVVPAHPAHPDYVPPDPAPPPPLGGVGVGVPDGTCTSQAITVLTATGSALILACVYP